MARVIVWTFTGIILLGVLGSAGSAVMGAVFGLLSDPSAIIVILVAFAGFAVLVAVPVGVGGLWIWRWWQMSAIELRRAAQFVVPDENGLLPVAESALMTGPGAMRAFDVHQAKATNVPSHINYAPRFTGGDAKVETMEQVAAAFQPETFWQLWQANKLPAQGFLMGYSLEDGEPVTADWGKLYSALIGGQSGSGKSTLIRSILAQSAIQGGRFVVLDKHYGAGEESLGESLQPLRHLMLCDVASTEQQMVDTLAYVRSIGEQRLAGVSHDKTPVVLVVDETTAVLQRSTTAQVLTDVLGQISQETRKVGVYAMCIGQNFHGKIMDTTVRDSFVSFLSCRTKRRTAATMSGDNDFGKMAQVLTIGQAVWMTPSGDVHKLAVPNCTEHDLELVAGRLGAKTASAQGWAITPVEASAKAGAISSAKAGADPVVSFDARAIRALEMTAAGASQTEIISQVWGVTGKGSDYKKASAEYRAILGIMAKQVMNG